MNKIIKKHQKTLLIGTGIISTILLLMLTFRFGNDYFWHQKAGEYMVKHHVILKTDVFSWYLASYQPVWISHEWLFEIILYLGSLLFGKYNGLLLTFVSTSLLYFILYRTNQKNFQKNILFTILWLLGGMTLTLSTLPRPFLLSNIFLALTLFLLYDQKKNPESKKIYFIPLISLLWVNIHGGSSNLAYILIFIFYFCGLFDFETGKLEAKILTKKQQNTYLIVLVLSVVALCFNPHGLKMLIYPYQNMKDSFMLATINEWKSIDFNNYSSLLYLYLLAVTVLPLLTSRKKIDLTDLLILLAFSYLGLKSIRFCPLAYIAFTYVVFSYVKQEKTPVLLHQAYFIASLTIIILCLFLFKMPSMERIDDEFITILQEKHPQKLYNFYDYGGYLISKNIPVFIDGRADLYSKYNYQDYYNLTSLRGPYEEQLKKYQFDYLLVDKSTPLSYYLSKNENYQLLLEKKNTALYQKKA